MQEINALSDRIRQTAYEIHTYLSYGHMEKVYENALCHRLRKQGIENQQQSSIQVFDEDGSLLGNYAADLLVEDRLIVELKTARTLAPEHAAQIIGYLKSARIKHGLLINFGAPRFEIRKYAL